MNWSRSSACLMVGEYGYKVAKFQIGDQAQYRASRSGSFIGRPQDSFEGAAQLCENNLAIMGEEESDQCDQS